MSTLRRWPVLLPTALVVVLLGVVACTSRGGSAGTRETSLLALGGGHGSVANGATVYAQNCAACHGDQLDGNKGAFPPLVGRAAVLDHPSAAELYQYVRRAMPYSNPGSLTDDQYYSVVAFLLNKNGVLGDNATLDASSIATITLPGANPIGPPLPGAPSATQQVSRGSSQSGPIVTPGPSK